MTVRVAEIGLAGAAGIAETGDSTAASGPQAESSGGIVRGNRPGESSGGIVSGVVSGIARRLRFVRGHCAGQVELRRGGGDGSGGQVGVMRVP